MGPDQPLRGHSVSERLRRLRHRSWPLLKLLFTLAILIFLGRHFWRDLRAEGARTLWHQVRLSWLVIAGLLYIAGLGMSMIYWYRLLQTLGQKPRLLAAIRAYYTGHLGKYLPGKAWALMLRATLIRSPGVRIGVAVQSSFYEVILTMAAGVLLGGILALADAPGGSADFRQGPLRHLLSLRDPGRDAINRMVLVILAAGLFSVVGLPTLPPVFNQLVYHLSLPFQTARDLPAVGWKSWFQGIILASFGWLLLGGSLWATLVCIRDDPALMHPTAWLCETAFVALAYVAGFVIVLVPSGLGVREFFLQVFVMQHLTWQLEVDPTEAAAVAVLCVLLLRVVWTAAEVLTVSIVYWLPGSSNVSLTHSE